MSNRPPENLEQAQRKTDQFRKEIGRMAGTDTIEKIDKTLEATGRALREAQQRRLTKPQAEQ